MKIYVGIDIAKLNHFAAAISSDGEIILEPFKFTNDAEGFQLLVSKLESFDKNSIIIGLESTAHYGDNLVRYLVAEFYQVCVLNPIKTCQIRKNNIRKTKTDKVDTYVIAKTLMMQDDLRFVSFYDLDMMDLKALGRFNSISEIANRLHFSDQYSFTKSFKKYYGETPGRFRKQHFYVHNAVTSSEYL